MTLAQTARVDQMTDEQFSAHMELVEARSDASELSDHALLREAKLAGHYEITDRARLIEVVAKAWVGA